MFTQNEIGERCWSWNGRLYLAREPQAELFSGNGWSLHTSDPEKSSNWVHYFLFTVNAGGRRKLDFAVCGNVFRHTADYRFLAAECPEALRFILDVHRGVSDGAFPEGRFWAINWRAADADRLGHKNRIMCPGMLALIEEIEKANDAGYAVGLAQRGAVDLMKTMRREHGVRADDTRDYFGELLRSGAIAHTHGGVKVVEHDRNKIRDRIAKMGLARGRV